MEIRELIALINEAHSEGHTFINRGNLDLPKAYGMLVRDGIISVRGEFLGLTKVVESEPLIAGVLKSKLSKPKPKQSGYEIPDYLTSEQSEAVALALSNNVSLITGGPGTGKTTILKAIYEAAAKDPKCRILCCAPTGRAAERAKRSINATTDGKSLWRSTSTIHRALKFNPFLSRFSYNINKKLPYEFVIVDEASMIDAELMAALLVATRERSRIVFVGDVNQIPPVGAGCPFEDMINSGILPTARLSRVFRQGEDSEIKSLAACVLSLDTTAVSKFNHMVNPLSKLREQLEKESLEASSIWLSPVNGGNLGIVGLNTILQGHLNPTKNFTVEIRDGKCGVGDKVTQRKNDYGLNMYNGDSGRVVEIERAKGIVKILGVDGAVKKYPSGKLGNISLGYALTIHRAQGSEWDSVSLIIPKSAKRMLSNRLLYTAITRAKRNLYIYADTETLLQAVGTAHPVRRTRLRELLVYG